MNQTNHKASLKISRDVVETIARVATLEVDGVASIADSYEDLPGFFSTRFAQKPIETNITNGIAEISVCINLELGAKITDVSLAVQRSVKENVQTMTGVLVNRVNITVMGIHLPEQEIKEPSVKKEIEIE